MSTYSNGQTPTFTIANTRELTKDMIVHLHQTEMSQSTTGKQLGEKRSTVGKWITDSPLSWGSMQDLTLWGTHDFENNEDTAKNYTGITSQ